MRLVHGVELLEELDKALHIFELQNDVLCQDGSQLDGLEANIHVLELQLAEVVALDPWVEDVYVALVKANVQLLLVVVAWEGDDGRGRC